MDFKDTVLPEIRFNFWTFANSTSADERLTSGMFSDYKASFHEQLT